MRAVRPACPGAISKVYDRQPKNGQNSKVKIWNLKNWTHIVALPWWCSIMIKITYLICPWWSIWSSCLPGVWWRCRLTMLMYDVDVWCWCMMLMYDYGEDQIVGRPQVHNGPNMHAQSSLQIHWHHHCHHHWHHYCCYFRIDKPSCPFWQIHIFQQTR